MRVGAIEAAAQFHRHVVVGVGHPLDAQQRRCPAPLPAAPAAAASAATARIFSSARIMRTPNSVSNSAYIGPLVVGQPLGGQALEQHRRAARGPRGWSARRRTTARAAPAPRRRRSAAPARAPRRPAARRRLQSSIARCAGLRCRVAARRASACRKRYCTCCSAWVATNVPLPWRRTTQVLRGQLVDRLAHRALAHRESARPGPSRWGSPRPASIRRPAGSADQALDLLVQRAERRRRRPASAAAAGAAWSGGMGDGCQAMRYRSGWMRPADPNHVLYKT